MISMKTVLDANQLSFQNVEGWVGDRIWTICEFIQDDQREHSVSGSIAEIGVHHGKLFFIISHIGNEATKLIAIDLFDDQQKNIDASGSGSAVVFQRHVDTLFPELAPRIKVVSADSMSLTTSMRSQVFEEPVRVFSVDGGHTVQHVINDMLVAQDVLAPRGTVMLDDFMGPLWPSVTEGFFQYMAAHNYRLAPYLIFQNKLFLTTYSEQVSVMERLTRYIEQKVGDEYISGRWRHATLCGYKVLCFV